MVFPPGLKEVAKPEYFEEWPELHDLALKHGVEAVFTFLEKYHSRLEENNYDRDKRFYVPKLRTVAIRIWGELEKEKV